MYRTCPLKILFSGSKPSNRGRSRTRGRGKGGRGRSTSSASERPVNQVATPDTKQHSDRSQSFPHSRFKESTLQKRRALNITSDQFVCFLCGGSHVPRVCKVYPNAIVQETPCSKCKYYHESNLCKSNSRRNSTSRSTLNHN